MNESTTPPEGKVVFANSFYDAMENLPDIKSDKVFSQLNLLRKNIRPKGLNLKKLTGAGEPFYSLRLNRGDRIILAIPEENFYFLVWAGRHDDAYDWASKHSIYFDPVTGSISIIRRPVESPELPSSIKGLFDAFSDEELLSVGVPSTALAKARSLQDRNDLWVSREYFPTEVYEDLVKLADGIPLEEIVGERMSLPHVKSWNEAIQLPQRDVKVWKSESLEQILCQPINRWRIFLHPDQQAIVDNPTKKPLMVKGAAGTGKTVVAMHRAAHLVKDPDWNPEKKLLFTTFTKNLALDIEQNLAGICTPEELERIEVVNIDKWVVDFLKKNGVDEIVLYPGKDSQTKVDIYGELFDKALEELPKGTKFKKRFVKDEWQNVILPNNITTEKEYLKADRKDYKNVLPPMDRKVLWPVFAKMRELLAESKYITYEDACFIAVDLLKKNPNNRPYDAVVVDEAQDLPAEALKVLAELATLPVERKGFRKPAKDKNEPRIFLAGDGFQRIYSKNVSLKDCGIDVSGERTKTLRVTYRTTEEIRKAAESVLQGHIFNDTDGGHETLKGVVSIRSGDLPVVKRFDNISEEVKWIDDQIRDLHMEPKSMEYPSICIVGRNKEVLKQYRKELENLGFTITVISQTKPEVQERDGLRIATMHRVKGLEFKAVFIVDAGKGEIPSRKVIKATASVDPALEDQVKLQERSLFYVACSRARDNLFVTSCSEEGEYMKEMEDYLDKIKKH